MWRVTSFGFGTGLAFNDHGSMSGDHDLVADPAPLSERRDPPVLLLDGGAASKP